MNFKNLWQDRPTTDRSLLWRYDSNPILGPDSLPGANSIFNSAVVPFQDGFAGVFRVDNKRREMALHAGFSENGIHWELNPEPISWDLPEGVEAPSYGYDPRVVPIDGRYLVCFCAGFHGPTIALGWTDDFKKFEMLDYALLPYNRNGVLFPRKISGRYMLLSRPSDRGHTPFGDIFLSQSHDLQHWGNHRFVMRPEQPWESTKIGAGPYPIETEHGWLLIYHGVLTSCNGYVYHFGACILNISEPWKVTHRLPEYLMAPRQDYERTGDVPNVVFPCAALTDLNQDRMAIYYGGADSYTAIAFGHPSEILKELLKNPV